MTSGVQGSNQMLQGGRYHAWTPLGLVLAAPVAEIAGVRSWYVAGAVICSGMGLIGLLLPSLRALEEQPVSPSFSGSGTPPLEA